MNRVKRKGADPVSEFVTKIKNKNVSQQRLQEISETAERLENQSEIHAYSSKCKKWILRLYFDFSKIFFSGGNYTEKLKMKDRYMSR